MLILEWKITRNVSIRKSVPGKEAGIARTENMPPEACHQGKLTTKREGWE